jgi:pimeloyl-ACP methyl ester carboxylesterase
VLIMSIFVEETQSEEPFSIYIPSTPLGVERPMLVAFHGFNVSHLDIWANTSFIEECEARDWILIAPYSRNLAPTGPGTSQISFGSAQSQIHVQAVIDYVRENFAVDRDRIYGVGFSMGGGAAMSYAARHRDSERGAFAAVVNHTGTISLRNTYDNVGPGTQMLMNRIFNGSPSFNPFEYLRVSSIDLDSSGNLVPGSRHMATNLVGVPVRTYYGIGDSEQYLVDQSLALDSFMSSISTSFELIALPSNCPATQQGHCWDTIDETEVCDWLELQSLSSPGPVGQVVADRNARWGNLRVEPTSSDDFATLDYSVSSVQSSIRLLGTRNVDEIELSLADLGLSPQAPFSVRCGSADLTGDRVLLNGLFGPPQDVLRNGISLGQDCQGAGASWCFDATTGKLRLEETSSVSSLWSIVP